MAQGRHRRDRGSDRAGPSDAAPPGRTVAVGESEVTARRTSLVAPAIGLLAALVVVVAVVFAGQRGGEESGTEPRSGPESTTAPASTPSSAEPTPATTERSNVSAAALWVRAQLPSGSRLLTDDEVDAELNRLNAPQQHEAVDGAADGETSKGWRDFDYIVSTEGLRGSADADVKEAIRSSSLLAGFGPEPGRIEVRRLEPGGPEIVQARREAQAAAGTQLAGNPRLLLTPDTRTLLRAGDVDPRLLVVLAAAADRHELTVADFPARAGEEAGPRRTVVITAVDGQAPAGTVPGDALRSWLDAQEPPFAPASAALAEGALVIGYDIVAQAPVDFLADAIFAGPLPA